MRPARWTDPATESLGDELLERVEQSDADERILAFVLASCVGVEDLRLAIQGEFVEESEDDDDRPAEERITDVFLRSISVAGFRGIGPGVTLDLEPAPGLTLVVGRNGSGKSSFAEALELLLTGEAWRWHDRPKAWQEGWRNLHHDGPVELAAELVAEGPPSPVTVMCTFAEDDGLDDWSPRAQPRGRRRITLEELGLAEAIQANRPFLSHSELGSILEQGPSKLYDSLSRILGLDLLVDGAELLRRERLDRQRAARTAADELQPLLDELETIDDPRARSAEEALRTTAGRWDLDTVDRLLDGASVDEDAGMGALRRVAAIEIPEREEIEALVRDLRIAHSRVESLRGTDAAAAAGARTCSGRRSSSTTTTATATAPSVSGRVRSTTDGDPPHRLLPIDSTGRAASSAAAQEGLTDSTAALRSLVSTQPAIDGDDMPDGVAVPPGLESALGAWMAAVDEDDVALADAVESAYPDFADNARALRAAAASELERREDAWRPVTRRLASWLDDARKAASDAEAIPDLKAAEDWTKQAIAEFRTTRFAPIARRAQEIWSRLSLNSNVAITDIVLEGASTQRRVSIDVEVDGQPGVALGVMSQGELHSLALSLFLPRATADDSPFRFVLIDDPVQAMDPSRVDGLAEVLHEVAGDRQVIVLTHDDRLPEAVRRLGFPATILEVTRRPGSIVDLSKSLDPVSQALRDANDLARSDSVPELQRRRLVPAFARTAIEAACVEAVRRRMLDGGSTHAEVEDLLRGAQRLTHFMALALFDDAEQGGDVLPTINSRWGRRMGDVYQACNRGVHEGYPSDLTGLVNDARSLAERVRTLA